MTRRMKRWALEGALIGVAVGVLVALPTGGTDWNVLLPAILGGLGVGLILGALAGRYWDRNPKV